MLNALNAYSSYASFSALAAYGAGAGNAGAAAGATANAVAFKAEASVQTSTADAACTVEISAEARLAATAAAPQEQTMEEFKRAFWDKLSQIPCTGMQGTSISINISEEGYAAMKADPEYEEKILGLFARDLQNPYYQRMRGGNVGFTVGATAEDYCARSWGAEYDFNKTKKDDDDGESIWEMIWRRHREFMEMQAERAARDQAREAAASDDGGMVAAAPGEAPLTDAASPVQHLRFTAVSEGFNTASAVTA